MNISSRKQKGQRAVNKAIKLISYILDIDPECVRCLPSSSPGRDISIDSKERYKFPYAIEVKNWETISPIVWWRQVLKYVDEDYPKPLVIFTGNRKRLWCLHKVKECGEYRQIKYSDLKWGNIKPGERYYFTYDFIFEIPSIIQCIELESFLYEIKG